MAVAVAGRRAIIGPDELRDLWREQHHAQHGRFSSLSRIAAQPSLSSDLAIGGATAPPRRSRRRRVVRVHG